MGRKEPAQGKHTSPDKVGFDDETTPKSVYNDETMPSLLEMYKVGEKNSDKEYKGLWTEDTFKKAVADYFDYVVENKIKPSKASLRLWLGCSRSTYYDWETKVEKYGYKSSILGMAHSFMESTYVGRVEKYPTGNIFLLKATSGYTEASRLDITTNGNSISSADEVRDLVSKLGLNVKSE